MTKTQNKTSFFRNSHPHIDPRDEPGKMVDVSVNLAREINLIVL